MRPILFLSDLHLHASRPHITEIFYQFLNSELVASSGAVYILGDLFEFWAGDDANTYPEILTALHTITDKGIPVYFMRGNRDFLIGEYFAEKTGCVLLEEPTVIEVDGQSILLLHGDTLCTDDIDYQAFREEVRSSKWQAEVIAMPLPERMEYFQSLREASQKSIQEKAAEIMDVNQKAVDKALIDSNANMLIHGHTHRQNIHQFTINEEPATRVVLGDWYESGNVLLLNSPSDFQFHELNNLRS